MSAQWVWAAVVWPWVSPDRWSLLWDLLCSEAQHQTPLVLQPTTCCGLVGAKGALGWGSICLVFPGAKDVGGCMGEWVTSWIGHFGGQHCVPWAVGWAWMSWVAGLSREQGFTWFWGPVGVPDSNWLLLLSSPSCFLVKMWEGEFWKSLRVGS